MHSTIITVRELLERKLSGDKLVEITMTNDEQLSNEAKEELLKELKIINDPEKMEEKLGRKLTEILDLINEINYDVLNNSNKYYFHLKINNMSYVYYLYSNEFGNIKNVSIEFVEGTYFIRTLSIIYININEIEKEEVLRWMLDTILKEDLSC